MRGIRYRVAMNLDGYIARPKGEFDWIVADPERDVADKERETVAALRAQPDKDLWLFGGGLLFRNILDAGLVDTVEVAVIPVLLGGGIPLLPARAERTKLK
jgi:dihydrofolate reductase